MQSKSMQTAPRDSRPFVRLWLVYPLMLLGLSFLPLLWSCSTTPSAPATPRLPDPPASLQKPLAPLPPLPRALSTQGVSQNGESPSPACMRHALIVFMDGTTFIEGCGMLKSRSPSIELA